MSCSLAAGNNLECMHRPHLLSSIEVVEEGVEVGVAPIPGNVVMMVVVDETVTIHIEECAATSVI